MKKLLISGIATSALMMCASGASASDSFTNAKQTASEQQMQLEAGNTKSTKTVHRWGGRKDGRWHAGWSAPGGWVAYRRPYRGFTLPAYWIQPRFLLSNYSIYRLNAPSNGYYWSRYYDDAVLRDARGNVTDIREGIDWNAYEGGYEPDHYDQPDFAPSIRPDNGVYNWNDNGNVGVAADGSRYRYEGGWVDGEFVDADKRVWEGDWEGRVIREGHGGPAGAPFDGPPINHHNGPVSAYNGPAGYEGYERCLKSNGVTGAALGAVVGAIAGNRIAGRGDRLEGSLLGAGLGGIAGAVIEKATSKCRKHVPEYRGHQQGYYPYGYQGGYYYYPAPVITTVTYAPVTTTTTTTTEEYYYETVPAPKKRVVKRKWKPKPKPRCVCR